MSSITVNVNIEEKLKSVIDDSVRYFAHESFYRHMSKYIPRDTGALMSTVDISLGRRLGTAEVLQMAEDSGNITSEGITFKVPYASRMHDGDGFNFSTEMNPLATSRWENHVDKSIVAEEITEFIKERK